MTVLDANTNVADGDATVLLQAGVVHDGVHIYEAPPGATPAQRFQIGLRYLEGGVAPKALEVIEEAMTAGHRDSRARFYWILAMLSGRTLSQLTDADEERLRHALGTPRLRAEDEWVEALRVIERFLTAPADPRDDPQTAIKAFDALPADRRKEILRHLELFLKDKIQDAMWQRSLAQARKEQKAADRRGRVWMYFQPTPRAPRPATPAPVTTTRRDTALAWAMSVVFLAATGYLGVLTVLSGRVPSMIAFLAAVAGTVPLARHGAEWWSRAARLRAREQLHGAPDRTAPKAPAGGFADDVDRLFRRYAGRYLPDGVDRTSWTAQMAGVHRAIRDEIVTSFRDSAPQAREIAWLVRHRLRDARDRWQDGTLRDYRARLRMPLRGRLLAVVGAAATVAGLLWALPAALAQDPFRASIAVAVAAIAGRFGVEGHLRIINERRRYAEDVAEAEARLRSDQQAFDRWTARLARRPTDQEMAAWLDCDRRILLDQAMRHYGLAPRHVIASAFIGGSRRPARRARVRNGPWRYSHYRLTVFLLTADGVRQMSADLDFAQAGLQIRQRTGYRYEAVASVHVTEVERAHPRFRLTLVNGEPIDVEVREADLGPPDARADSSVADAVSLDSAGLANTLYILEGIAAEGKRWVHLDRQRRGSRVSVLKKAIEALTR
ncbi:MULTISPECIES: hypothetical protein [Catenuloplanes]|uniref:Uncharacterized protein n=1 Tax=Catenuloplanes niger TaxID=587534 RepID=A0AAE4CVH4_9ACTN|nr:hypothetical protein [Catenuloplanes niger]MDR7322814.1 hypothetical protein [Catenuloplanes niger]